MSSEGQGLSRASAGFAMAAATVAIFNTLISWAKDADRALLNFMNGIAGHNWTTQGLADVILFFVLGLILSKSGSAGRMQASRLTSFLVISVVAAGVGLFAWYALF